MQRKLNEEFIKEYSRQFSEKITSEFFAEKEHINGKEILNISPSRQVNFFVFKILFGNWQDEMKKLESPYFDYRDPDVRRAMVDFMNILSQKIQIDEDHFYELLEEAVYDTLKLAVLPQKFLYDELIQKDINGVNEKVTRPLLKYLKLHKPYFEKFFQENSGEELDTFLDKSREFFEGVDVQETVEGELEKLSEVRPIRIQDLLEMEEELLSAPQPEEGEDFASLGPDFSDMEEGEGFADFEEDSADFEEDSADFEEDSADFANEDADEAPDENLNSFEDDDKISNEEEPEELTERPAAEEQYEETAGLVDLNEGKAETVSAFNSELENTFGNEAGNELSEDFSVDSGYEDEAVAGDEELTSQEQDDIQEKIESIDEISNDEPSEERPLNQKYSAENTTINDQYANEDKFTVADKLEKKKVEDIMEAISVNHRYMFTKELFDGDRDEFNAAISKIEKCRSFDEAVEMLVEDYAKSLSWDMNSEEVKELLKVVFRKFR